MFPLSNHKKHKQPNKHGMEAEVEGHGINLPPALQFRKLTHEEVFEMKRILDDSTQPAYEGREMPTANICELLKKNR